MDNHNNPLALSPEKLTQMLLKLGFKQMTIELLQQDEKGGAPRNADGTFNLVHYMAWMIKEVNGNGNESDPS